MGDLVDIDAAVVCLLLVVTVPALCTEHSENYYRYEKGHLRLTQNDV